MRSCVLVKEQLYELTCYLHTLTYVLSFAFVHCVT
jgi:hypothetical protein